MAGNLVLLFGKNVKTLRENLGYSQEILAELSNLHRTYISDIECFKRSISLNNIEKLARALGVPAWKLFWEEDKNG